MVNRASVLWPSPDRPAQAEPDPPSPSSGKGRGHVALGRGSPGAHPGDHVARAPLGRGRWLGGSLRTSVRIRVEQARFGWIHGAHGQFRTHVPMFRTWGDLARMSAVAPMRLRLAGRRAERRHPRCRMSSSAFVTSVGTHRSRRLVRARPGDGASPVRLVRCQRRIRRFIQPPRRQVVDERPLVDTVRR